ncbi:MAG: hypothetical protein WBK91_04160 [Alphaproteobacteria bacterium]
MRQHRRCRAVRSHALSLPGRDCRAAVPVNDHQLIALCLLIFGGAMAGLYAWLEGRRG